MMNMYKHFKGGIYTLLLDTVFDADDPTRHLVIYSSLVDGQRWARSAGEFFGMKDGVRRFAPVTFADLVEENKSLRARIHSLEGQLRATE